MAWQATAIATGPKRSCPAQFPNRAIRRWPRRGRPSPRRGSQRSPMIHRCRCRVVRQSNSRTSAAGNWPTHPRSFPKARPVLPPWAPATASPAPDRPSAGASNQSGRSPGTQPGRWAPGETRPRSKVVTGTQATVRSRKPTRQRSQHLRPISPAPTYMGGDIFPHLSARGKPNRLQPPRWESPPPATATGVTGNDGGPL